MDKNKKIFKKIYLEITNACNLSCSFCIQNKRKIKYLNINQFKIILDKLEDYTDYLYFHILGEPLMHPKINEFIEMAGNRFFVQITTNGYLIDKIEKQKNIRQINISLHSFDEKYNISLENYMTNIFKVVDNLLENGTYVSLRLWVKNKNQSKMIRMLNDYYGCEIDLSGENYTIKEKLYVNQFHEFIWPDLGNHYYEESGGCYALRDHIGILVDGTIIPCCLDTKGIINLGNIYKDELEDALKNERVKKMMIGFQCKQKTEELCKHCSFIE